MTAKPIMVQGTMSGVGKSLVVAGLCRVLADEGLRVAPFKSQNMALNSCITADGLEMGRAQVMQAEAARIEPEANMNPILLKPTNDTGSQVIVNGKPIGTMSARDYFAFKHELVPDIMAAYNSLAERFDVIVIEGAGSPAEINLKADDIVNMGMARMAHAPVLLVGDIDRGGVFAQLAGTIMLLEPEEQDMVKALVVNKFRGDPTILEPGIEQLRELTGKPVAGVLPMTPLDLDDEDSLSDRFDTRTTHALVDIAVVRVPRISNFTDFMSLDAMEHVSVRYVTRANELGEPDLIVLPGTKSTIGDLKWLRESGMEAAILKRVAAGTPVFGICGGYQMLGVEISDPEGVEGGGTIRGLGLLPTSTVFSAEKRQVRVEGELPQVDGVFAALSGARYEGYEIHMGETTRVEEAFESVGAERASSVQGSAPAPCSSELPLVVSHDNVYGTYVHGIFDTAECSRALVGSLLEAKGLDASSVRGIDMRTYKEQQYEALGQMIRDNMDMDLVKRIIEEGV